MSVLPTRDELKEIALDSITNAFIPGKAIQDAFIESSLNKKYNIYSYSPVGKGFFSPFDFTPVGAISRFGKGYKMVKGGKKMIKMKISGFGRKLRNEGYTTMMTAVASKLVGGYVSTDKLTSGLSEAVDQRRQQEQSGGGSSLPSMPKPPGKQSHSRDKPTQYVLGRSRNWAKGTNPCASGYKLDYRGGIYYCVRK